MPSVERLFYLECLVLLEKEVVFGAAAASYVATILIVIWLVGGVAARQWSIFRHHCSIVDVLREMN
jgi:hypothetical protein